LTFCLRVSRTALNISTSLKGHLSRHRHKRKWVDVDSVQVHVSAKVTQGTGLKLKKCLHKNGTQANTVIKWNGVEVLFFIVAMNQL